MYFKAMLDGRLKHDERKGKIQHDLLDSNITMFITGITFTLLLRVTFKTNFRKFQINFTNCRKYY